MEHLPPRTLKFVLQIHTPQIDLHSLLGEEAAKVLGLKRWLSPKTQDPGLKT